MWRGKKSNLCERKGAEGTVSVKGGIRSNLCGVGHKEQSLRDGHKKQCA